MKIEKFEDLEIWKEARELCKFVYSLTNKGLFVKDYKLRDQIRASSGSVMDNIAEGFERGGNKEFVQFLFVAKGSCGETRSQSYRALDQLYINQLESDELLLKTKAISAKIASLIIYLKNSDFKGPKFH